MENEEYWQKPEKIVEPSETIQEVQSEVVTKLEKLLPDTHIELVGAMAVPMVGRPEIDVMVITDDVENVANILNENGCRQGPVVDGISFLSDHHRDKGIEVGIQVIPTDHSRIETHRSIIKTLREDKDLMEEYVKFKKGLDGLSREEYKKKKGEWIKENILSKF